MKPKQSFSNRGGSSAKRQRHAQSRRPRPLRTLHFTVGLFAALAPLVGERAAAITWIGGNVDWVDATGTANWSPADEPDPDDPVIFSTANTVNLGSNNAILSLALSGGISLNTNNFDLTIDGLLQLAGAGTDITIADSTSTVQADQVTINSGGTISLTGGVLNVIEETDAGLLDINAGGTLSGNGTINLQDGVAATTTLMINSGTLSAWSFKPVIGAPAVGTLQVNASDPTDARLDLDAFAPVTSVVNVFRNQTLDINVTLFDAYSGDLNLFHNSTLDMSAAWSIDAGATVDVDNGNTGGFLPAAADTSFIAGAAFTQTGGIITVIDTDGTLQFDAPFTQSGGDLVNNGLVVFNRNATIGAGANFTMPGETSSLTVNAGVEVNIDQANFNADGGGFSTNVITVGSGGILDLDVGTGADIGFNGTILLNGGELDVTSTAVDAWSIVGPLTVGAATGVSPINGEPVTFSGPVTIGANSVLDVNAASTLNSSASFALAAGARLYLNGNTLNGITSITGDGTLQVYSATTVAANSTIAVGTFDWDGTAPGTTHTINSGVTLTVTSPNIDTDGNIDDNITLAGTGSTLTVNGPTEWTMNGALNSNPAAAGTATVGGSSRVIFGDAINANSGTTWIDSTATLGNASLATVAAGAVLHFDNPVTLQGGVITGDGTLRIDFSSEVSSYNTVAVQTVDWDGTASGSSHIINDGATLAITCTNFDSDGDMDDPLTIRGNNATLNVGGFASWEMVGNLTTNPAAAGTAFLAGNAGILMSGNFNANGNTTANARITFGPSSVTTVAAAATLDLNAVPTFSGGEITGAGRLRIGGSPTVTANTTISVGSLDWDRDNLTHTHTINQGVNLTITSPVIENGGMRDALRVFGNGGTLTVSGPTSWDMRNTLTTNPTAVGTATLTGTSRMVLTTASGLFNANGNTTVSAPITFDTGSITTVAAPAVLTVNGDAIYNGGTITGAGDYWPPTGDHNTVTANSTISTTNFNFDRGNWTVEPSTRLTVNVGDYDSDVVSNGFGTTLTLNSGIADVSTADAVFVMAGTLNMNNSTGTMPYWIGEAIQIGNDVGTLDSNLNVTGAGASGIYSPVIFESDADVKIAAGSTLWLFRAVTFQSVNGANNASFTGGGALVTNDEVHYDEATTLNLPGGRVDLDGTDTSGDTHYVMAPLTINVATFDSFGKSNVSGTNIIDVNGWTGSGSLTVNLDNPAAEWTLNGLGVLRLINDPTAAASLTLLAGSDVNLNGTLNVIGDVRTTARVDIGGTVEIQTAAKPFRLSGGDLTDTNTLVGGTINGPGLLGADSGSGLMGYGTIHANIDFDGSADLFADNGTLTLNGSILDARYVGTNDTDGVLNVVNAWNTTTVTGVYLKGGELKGGLVTNDGAGGIFGSGLVSSRVINNSIINANNNAAPLILETAANDNDWDGDNVPETGRLQANSGTLEIRDTSGFAFNGTVNASNGGVVFANGFALTLQSSSTLSLANGTFRQSAGLNNLIYGTVTIGAGVSTLRTDGASGGFSFSGNATTLNGNLQLDNPVTLVTDTATFGGTGRLINLPSRQLAPNNLAVLNVLVENRGTLAPGAAGSARNDMLDYVQTATGNLAINLNGTTLGTFDRLQINGSAQLAGTLQLALGGGYLPALNDTITILSTTGVVAGLFSPLVQPAGMPAGLAFEVNYLPNSVQLRVVSATPFDAWIKTFGIANPADRTKAANPDGDSLNNLGEFATDGNPTSGLSSGKIVGKIAPVGGVNAMTLTLPVRNGTLPDPADPAGGEFGLKQTADGLFYKIQASDALGTWTLTVAEVNGVDAAAIQLGLPALNPGWTYRTFRSPGPVAGDPVEFMRAVISD